MFEKCLSKPLHWLICLLHLNELPLKTLFENLDGKTSGPSNFQGEAGRKLNLCTKLPVTKFERIRCYLDALNLDLKVLSKVQKYLFEFYCGINSGKISQRLENLEPGPAVHSRWLTHANRILRLTK